MATHLRKRKVLTKISEGVRFARRRFGRYDVIDFLVVLFGYATSGERTLEAFYDQTKVCVLQCGDNDDFCHELRNSWVR